MAPEDCTTNHTLILAGGQACGTPALAHGEQTLMHEGWSAQWSAHALRGTSYSGARWHGDPDLALHSLARWGRGHAARARTLAAGIRDSMADGGLSSTWTDEELYGALHVPTLTTHSPPWCTPLGPPSWTAPCARSLAS